MTNGAGIEVPAPELVNRALVCAVAGAGFAGAEPMPAEVARPLIAWGDLDEEAHRAAIDDRIRLLVIESLRLGPRCVRAIPAAVELLIRENQGGASVG